jgi:hypothetical protein
MSFVAVEENVQRIFPCAQVRIANKDGLVHLRRTSLNNIEKYPQEEIVCC